MLFHARILRVGWLGVGIFTVANASAGPAVLRFDDLAETLPPVDTAAVQAPAETPAISKTEPIYAVIDLPQEPRWVAVTEPISASVQLRSGPLSGDSPLEPLTVPVAPFGVIGLIGLGSALSYVGARWLGLRR